MALDEGDGKPYVPPKKKKRKPPIVRGEQHSGGPKTPKKSGPSPGHPDGRAQPGAPRPPAWVIRRQRQLRRRGFGVVVDGQWGPKSQKAWEAFRRLRSTRREIRANIRRLQGSQVERVQQLQLNARGAAQTARSARAAAATAQIHDRPLPEAVRRPAAPSAIYDAESARARIHNQVFVAQRLRDVKRRIRDERLNALMREMRLSVIDPAKLQVSDLRTLLFDPHGAQFDPLNRGHVRLVQRFLRAHGYKKIAADGQWNPDTFHALRDAMDRAEAAERREQIEEIRDRFYRSGIIRPGDEIPFLGEAPKPGELLRILQEGGFTAAMALNWLEQRGQQLGDMYTDPRYVDWRADFLDAEIRKLHGNLYTPIFGITDLQRQMALPAAYGVFYQASNFGELQTELRLQEARAKREQAERIREAQESKGFWGEAFDVINYPVTKVKENLLAASLVRDGDGGIGSFVYDAIAVNVADITGRNLPTFGGAMDYTEALDQSRATWTELEEEHPWANFAIEVVLDPLNLVGAGFVKNAFLAPARLATYSVRAAERAGLALDDAQRIRNVAAALKAPAEASRWADRSISQFSQAAGRSLSGSRGHRAWLRATSAYEAATRAKKLAIGVARERVRQAGRLGFEAVDSRVPGAAARQRKLIRNVSASTRQLLNDTDISMQELADAPIPRTLDLLARERFSFNVDDAASEFSSVGWQLRSSIASRLEATAVKRVARQKADEVTRLVADQDEKYLYLMRKGREAEARAYLHGIRDKHTAEFTRQYGSWFTGAGDPAVMHAVREMIGELVSDLDNVLIPAWQKKIRATVGDDVLFDAEGKWVGLGGAGEAAMRDVARQSLDYLTRISFKNPNRGKYFDERSRDYLINDELAREANSLRAYHNIERASGRDLGDDWLETRLLAAEKKIRGAWEEVPKRGWTDTREILEAPAIYLRQMYGAIWPEGRLDSPLTDIISKLEGEGLIETVGTPTLPEYARAVYGGQDVYESPRGAPVDRVDPNGDFLPARHAPFTIDRELLRLTDWMSGGAADLDELAFRADFAPSMPLLPEDAVAADVVRFRQAVRARREALRIAYNETLSGALREQGALWQAFRNTQRKWAKVAYWTFAGPAATWRFSVLALRPGWVVRNTADNTIKLLLAGVTDPRYFFVGAQKPGSLVAKGGQAARTVFDVGLYPLKASVRFLDDIFGTNAYAGLQAAEDAFWAMSAETLRKVFWMYDVYVPENVLHDMRFLKAEEVDLSVRAAEGAAGKAVVAGKKAVKGGEWMRDTLWEMTGNRPEMFARRTLYRSTFVKELRRLRNNGVELAEAEAEASRLALKRVNDTLFDYSNISVAEDNFRLFFPFIYYWRKNTPFWARQFVEKPWLLGDLGKFEEAMAEWHEDWPEWMRRYVSLKPLADVVARVPGLSWMAPALEDSQYDPLNFVSLAPLYRMFKGENELLPDEGDGFLDGMKFIGPMVTAIQDSGLGLSPFVRKPLEAAGVLGQRTWQSIFPQTQLIQAFTMKFWEERFPLGLNIEAMLLDPVLQAMGATGTMEAAAQRFNEFVQREMAGQVARGERPSRAAAEKKIRDFLLVQTVVGYFSGAYIRNATPQDIYLYQIAEGLHDDQLDYLGLSAQDKAAYSLFKRRGWDQQRFDEYVEALPMIQAYYQLEDYDAKEAFKLENPEVIPFVEPVFSARIPSSEFIATQALVADTAAAQDFYRFVTDSDIDQETWKVAENILVPPELREFWRRNDTYTDHRREQIRGFYFRHLSRLSDAFHAIPEKDYDAKEGFLREHPELTLWWDANNSAADDYRLILNHANADLRDRYFEFVEAGDWDSASAFLKQFPFIFEFTAAADRVVDGQWLPKQAQHAKDYLQAKPWLDIYFSLPESERAAWLRSGTKGARIVQAYFDKYSDRGGRGMTQHARDYLAVKSLLDHYFSLAPAARSAWLNGTADGAKVKAYFAKYAKTGSRERAFNGADSALVGTRNAELRKRLEFWRRYFKLRPSDRPWFVHRYAERYGIFVYGVLGSRERHDREAEWFRRAIGAGATDRAAHYLYVKPLLDFFFTLKTPFEKQLFLRANPELQTYLDDYARKTATGDPRLDRLIERYFKLPEDSPARSRFLKQHPEVQDYFDSKSTPAERALHRLLEVYFDIRDPQQRERFLVIHPEIQEYFDRRQRQRGLEQTQLEAFDDTDPRLRPYLEAARASVGTRGEAMRLRLALDGLDGGTLGVRR